MPVFRRLFIAFTCTFWFPLSNGLIFCEPSYKSCGSSATGRIRTYYIAAVEVDWDYAPQGNLLGKQSNPYAERYLRRSLDPPRIGKVYRKAVYREFTDETYTVEKPIEPWQGLLGPILIGEIGDELVINYYNNVSMQPTSMHPHGVRYGKLGEGALYDDSTGEFFKRDDRVPPGGHHQYRWFLIQDDTPTRADQNCITWAYHSHKFSEPEINAGLIGAIIVCKKGVLDNNGQPSGIAKYFVFLYNVFDENESFLIDYNINRLNPDLTPEEREELKDDPNFSTSNFMQSINGYSFGNLRGVELCAEKNNGFHMIGIGSFLDIHSINFEGQVFRLYAKRKDIFSLYPARFQTAIIVPPKTGEFIMKCETSDYAKAGMQANYSVVNCGNEPLLPAFDPHLLIGIKRRYYIAAEEVEWDYGPSGYNKFTNVPLTEDEDASPYFIRNATRIGGIYRKAVYREYKDGNFRRMLKRQKNEVHLGLQGPIMRAEVGDIIVIEFLNKASRPYNIETHGAAGADTDHTPVPSGRTKTYIWKITERHGPTATDPQCISWRYFSGVDFDRDAWDGLSGVLLTCKPGTLDRNGKQKGIDHEFSLFFIQVDENFSHFLRKNIKEYIPDPRAVNTADPRFMNSNIMSAINGRMFGNLEGLNMCAGERVAWYLSTTGKQADTHIAYFHGQTFSYYGGFQDTIYMTTSQHHTVLMKAINPGLWALDCKSNEYYDRGMRAIFRVRNCGRMSELFSLFEKVRKVSKVREYFIAAVEEEWNFAPLNRDIITGGNLLENEAARVFLESGPDRIGRIYKKALFREFTDSSFQRRKPRSIEDMNLEIMGPMIRAEVGEKIRVVFRNMASRPYSVHPHGLLQEKPYDIQRIQNEGRDELPVLPGHTTVYEWLVTERSGPGDTGFNCTTRMYYSAVDPVKDTNSGLVGPLILCRKGTLNHNGERQDVDRELTLLFSIFDENLSWYLQENVDRYTTNPSSVDINDAGFMTSNRMHAVNGRMYGNTRGLVTGYNTSVAWYNIGMGGFRDIHTIHFHGQTFVQRIDSERRADVVDVFPGIFDTVQMFADNPGTWIIHCHVGLHFDTGMSATYTVLPPVL